MTENEEEPRYVISIAARMIGVRAHTLRYYEKIGIMEPSRSRGNIRLYTDSEITRLKRIKSLMEDLGINLAGAEVILRMGEHIELLQRRVAELEAKLSELENE